MNNQRHKPVLQILGRVKRDEFIGRSVELERLLAHASFPADGAVAAEAQGMLVLTAPVAGVSELLRQTFDTLFSRREEVVPIYFALPRAETTAVSAAIEFLNTFLRQYFAFRRDEPELCHASLTLNDLLKLAPAPDLDWIQELVETYNQHRFGENDRELVRFCLTAPARVLANDVRVFVMFDASQLANYFDSPFSFASEIIKALNSLNECYVLAGLRREILGAVESVCAASNAHQVLRLDRLSEDDGRNLVSSEARRQEVVINDESRDLLVQQLEGTPFFINAILRAAREAHLPLESYLACERLYIDELMGGRLNRYFSSTLEVIAPQPDLRAAVVRLLCEALPGTNRTASIESWRRRLQLDAGELEQLLQSLHIYELINRDGATIDVQGSSEVWRDYLRSRFRLDALREPRALVVADVMASALKRAPQKIARHYRRAAGLPLRELVGTFSSQFVPQKLFQYAQYAEIYKGAMPEEISSGLDSDKDLLRLPQIFHAASGVSFSRALNALGEENSVVAHGFEGAAYTDENEIVWLVGKLESKLEADVPLVEQWLRALENVARQSGFVRTRLWLIANEGFSAAATELLRAHNAYSSSHQQFEILSSRLNPELSSAVDGEDEFVLILPMGADNEMLAASTAEQIARRLGFSTEAVNQIKTAVVEACINASEHSLSPDRKIYQRFRVEDDKLVITISSRGILPANLIANFETAGDAETRGAQAPTNERRGWGLKLIRTLMDEVEFERVDEGTKLRMTKYLRSAKVGAPPVASDT